MSNPASTPNWANRTIWTGDNLPIMRGMNSESVDLIYLDPPFNSKSNYAAPIGSEAAGAEFKDTWALNDIDEAWVNLIEQKHRALHRVLLAAQTKSDKSYLIYMAARLLEMRRLLKPTGSIYLHCDPTMSHYLKLVMDAIWGRKLFRNEIVWCYDTAGRTRKFWNKKHDVILMYIQSKDYLFNSVKVPRRNLEEGWESWYRKIDKDGRRYQIDGKGYKYYADEGRLPNDWWDDIRALHANRDKERLGYPTQKPLKLLQRIIKASSNEGDLVLDPFCGCATAPVAAEQLGRRWVGIDISPKAAELVQYRLNKDEIGTLLHKAVRREDIPQRTDLGKLPKYNCKENKQFLYGKQEGYCAGCIPPERFAMHNLEVDHIVSRAEGGTDHLGNLQLLCGRCNRVKGKRGMEYLRAKLQMDSSA